ncbi:MAG: TlpA disulfide reductase family protein [Tissierellia bacterium]|nr:TlpA disulfide reductase family protein [Tissierellia bacterium]
MRKSFFSIFLLIPTVLFSQNSKKIQLVGITENADIQAVGIMHIDNPFDDSEFNYFYIKEIIPKNGHYTEILEIDKPREVLLFTPNNFARPVFLTPGDSVTYKMKRDEKNRIVFEFYGENAAHYNYNFIKTNTITSRPEYFKKGGNILNHKKIVKQYRDDQLKFLEDYRKQYSVSGEFYDYAKASINNRYIYDLYLPIESKQILRRNIPNGYFDESIIAVNPVADLYIPALWNLGMDSFIGDIYKDFGKAYKYILKNFEGEEKAYMLSAFIGKLAFRGDLSYRDELLELIEKMPSLTSDATCLNYIDKAKDYYTLMEKPLPDEVLGKTFLTEYGSQKRMSLKEVLHKYKDRAVFIDFWASWCGPCINDIRQSARAKSFLKERDVVYLYIGHKDELEKWASAAEKYDITEDQYLEENSRESPLTEYFKIVAIPRYILLNKEHKVASVKTPRPVPESFSEFQHEIRRLTAYRYWGRK